MFEPYLKSFFVRTSDLTRIKLLKLDILTNLATDSNVFMILRELRTYLFSSDKQFVAATIQAIGRCACSISDVTDSCLNGLVTLLSSKDGKSTVYSKTEVDHFNFANHFRSVFFCRPQSYKKKSLSCKLPEIIHYIFKDSLFSYRLNVQLSKNNQKLTVC